MNTQPTDVVFETDGLTYRGLAWGDASKPLVFAIHRVARQCTELRGVGTTPAGLLRDIH